MPKRIDLAIFVFFTLFGSLESYATEKAPSQPARGIADGENMFVESIGVHENQGEEYRGGRYPVAVRRPVTALRNSKFTFRLPDLEGNMISNSDKRFKNKVVFFDLWGTWCPPCREMTPFIKKLHAEYESEGLVVVGIACELLRDDGEDPKKFVSEYVSKNDIKYLTLYAGADEHATSLAFDKFSFREFDGFPTVVIVDRDGKVKRIEDGYDEKIAGRLEAAVQDLLVKK